MNSSNNYYKPYILTSEPLKTEGPKRDTENGAGENIEVKHKFEPNKPHPHIEKNTMEQATIRRSTNRSISGEVQLPIKSWKQFLTRSKFNFERRLTSYRTKKLKKSDLIFIRALGSGSYSKVWLVKQRGTSNNYAAKIVPKKCLFTESALIHALNEKLILQGIRFVFTIHLEYFFQDRKYLFYILPYVSGGELFAYLCKVKKLKEPTAKFYSAQMLLALEYLHHLGLIFRDLKPENILFDNLGYLKLADFGFCKKITSRTYTFCCTPEYVAPEMLMNNGYGKSVDWWTFGVFIFELCAGYTPFYSKSEQKIISNILNCKYRMPAHYSSDLKHLITNILQPDLTRRYGNLRGGVEDIKKHKWFESIPWLLLLNRQLNPPYVPEVLREEELTSFDRYSDQSYEDFLSMDIPDDLFDN